MLKRFGISVALALPLTGCANMEVKKVPLDMRIHRQDDHVRGFRYYLSRPYVVVQAAVPVSEKMTLVVLRQQALTFLEGARAGQTIPLDHLAVTNPATGQLQPVSAAELTAMREVLKNGSKLQTAGSDDSRQAAPDSLEQAALDASGPLGLPGSPKQTPPSTVSVEGSIQIVFLPDLDEQYTVKSCNILAKTAFGLTFKDGWQLTDVSGEHDSTTVTLELINLLNTAINAAHDVGVAEIKAGGSAGPQVARDVAEQPNINVGENVFQLVERTYIKPGVYRLNKPWEIEHPEALHGCGLLAKLGLPAVTEVQLLRPMQATSVYQPTAPAP
jgi:hypothetical protein